MGKKVYSYEICKDGRYLLTSFSTDINLYLMHRILGKCKPIGKRAWYEEIEIKFPYPSYKKIRLLVERKNITFKMLKYVLSEYTVQTASLSEIIQDKDLLDDMGLEVLTRKHYYPQPYPHIVDEYQLYKKSDVNDELINSLKTFSNNEMEIYECELKRREESDREREERFNTINWHKI